MVGVVGDLRNDGVDREVPATIYWPAMIHNPWRGTYTPRAVTFVVRSLRAGTQSFLREVQQAVWQVNPDIPVASLHYCQQLWQADNRLYSRTLS